MLIERLYLQETGEDYSVEPTDSKRSFRAQISLDLLPMCRTFLRK